MYSFVDMYTFLVGNDLTVILASARCLRAAVWAGFFSISF